MIPATTSYPDHGRPGEEHHFPFPRIMSPPLLTVLAASSAGLVSIHAARSLFSYHTGFKMTKQELFAAMLPYVLALIFSVATALFGWLVQVMRAHHINTTIIEAVGRAAGASYMSLVKSNKLGQATSISQAVDIGAKYMADQVPDAIKSAGLSPDAVAQMVNGELGKLLANDSTVSSGITPPTMTVIHEFPSLPPSGDTVATITQAKATP